MSRPEQLHCERTWLVTGAAGFIGSHLVESLLRQGQRVIGLDNFSTGTRENLDEVLAGVGPEAARRWTLVDGDIRDLAVCRRACAGVEVVLHEAGLGSIQRSLKDPIATHQVNVDGSLNLLVAARDARVSRFVFASSSSVYGDEPGPVRVEGRVGRPRSPYALSKRIGELHAQVFSSVYGLSCIGLRYFNVFGPRQSPAGPYAAVIPLWIAALLERRECVIFGDGETSRDFCYVENVVQANLLAAMAAPAAADEVYNVGTGSPITLNRLFKLIRDRLAARGARLASRPAYRAFRPGDARHSSADIAKARTRLGYIPSHTLAGGLDATIAWAAGGASISRIPSRTEPCAAEPGLLLLLEPS